MCVDRLTINYLYVSKNIVLSRKFKFNDSQQSS